MGNIVQHMLFIYSSHAVQTCLIWRTPSKERLRKPEKVKVQLLYYKRDLDPFDDWSALF